MQFGPSLVDIIFGIVLELSFVNVCLSQTGPRYLPHRSPLNSHSTHPARGVFVVFFRVSQLKSAQEFCDAW